MSLVETLPAEMSVDCGDHQTVQALYRKTGRAALSKAEYIVGRRDVAEEIVQEAFLRLWKKRPRFPDEKAAFVWIYKTCHNAAIDHLRTAATRRERTVDNEVFASVESACGSGNLGLKRHFIGQLMAKLGDREVQILVYRVIDGMTQEEIADLLGLSRKTVVRASATIEAKLQKMREKSYG